MIKVEGGTFMMGAKNTEPSSFTFEKPQHEVTLSTFSIGETEVTQELYKAVMGVNPSINKENQNPVECVDWNDCKAFVDRLSEITGKNFRLPTEAEWEYAAIGGKYTHYYIFSGSNRAADVAWYITNSGGSSHTVKQLQPNELGLYDMSGNVYEWVNDWYVRYTADPQTDPQGPDEGTYKVYRGGAWNVGAGDARCHFRYMRETTYKTQYHGFRIAL
jgi:formylglycine-generating enzyme required for sulfatase activity